MYIWNSILNQNDFFVLHFDNINIPKIYTVSYFGLSLVSMPLTYYLDHHFSIFTTLEYFSYTMFLSFNLLYFLCIYIPIGRLKYIIFFLLMIIISISDLVYNSLGAALASRFNTNENTLLFTGKAFSGLMTNLLMMLSILLNRSKNVDSIFKVYLWVGNAVIIFYLLLKIKFFRNCLKGIY